MKKLILGLFLTAVITVSAFADSVWHFRSGAADLGYKYFTSAVVYNNSGWKLDVNGQTVFNNSKSLTQFSNVIVVTSDAYNSNRLEAIYSIEGGQLIVTILKR